MTHEHPLSKPPKSKTGSRKRRQRRGAVEPSSQTKVNPAVPGTSGGRYQPIPENELPKLDEAIRHVLVNTGLSEAPLTVIDAVTAAGGTLGDDGRLCFPAGLIERYLAEAQRDWILYGQITEHDMCLSPHRVHLGTGGASPKVVDLDTGRYRDSTLQDLYDAARLCDTLDHVHFFSRSLVARDMPTELLIDVNTAYACLSGTQKHVFTSISQPEHVRPIAEMCYLIAGSHEAFERRPFISLNINFVVPPLRFHAESCEVMAEAVKLGIPVHCNVFSQVGASTPVTLAGAIVQNTAEALAGMIFAWLVEPGAKTIMGVRPIVTDLRTGGMGGGSGEQALVMAASAQMANYYSLPNSCIAGATDSKLADAQSGYEKSMTVTMAALAGSNLVTQAAGTHAGLMATAFESYVIDNDMLGGVMRTLSPFEVNDVTLATGMIDQVVRGEGHFLGHPETYKRMASDFLYPQIGDRRSPEEWEAAGSRDIREIAKEKTRQILSTHQPSHIPADVDAEIRRKFDIRLERKVD
ncbi:MAG: trimethylamine methyltransferase family protein [Chloroflexota bacterium]